MEMSGDFYTILGRASSSGYHFGLASLSCLCGGRVHASALWSVLGSVKPVLNCRWCYCKALPCLSGNAAHLGFSGFAPVLKGHLSAVLVEAAWDALILVRILMTKRDWRQALGGQSQTGILHIKPAKLVWVCLSLGCQDPTNPEAWLDVPALFCGSSKGGKICKKNPDFLSFSSACIFFPCWDLM